LRVGDFPAWPFWTFTNTRAHFLQTHDELILDAGGALTENHCSGDYSAIYLNDVSGDFVVRVRLISQEVTSAKACAGLVVKNDVTDRRSSGTVVLYNEPKYGSQQAWRGDHDGDGQLDSICYGWGAYPLWFTLEKRGTTFTGYTSLGGELWHIPQVCCSDKKLAKDGVYEISSAKPVQDIGLFAYANSDQNDLSRTVFDNFRLARPIPPEEVLFSDLAISRSRLDVGESFTVDAKVTSHASVAGVAKVGFFFDKHEPLTRWIDLNPGESQQVEFTLTPERIKSHLWLVELDPDYIFGDHQMTIGTHQAQMIHVNRPMAGQ